MSFSNDVKNEVIANKPLRVRYKQAQAYGLLLYAKRYSPQEVALHTENPEIVELFTWFVKDFAGRSAEVKIKERKRRENLLYEVSLPQKEDREALLKALPPDGLDSALTAPEQEHMFIAGAWLACGNITDPSKSYHLEFVCKDEALCAVLEERLLRYTAGIRRTLRRGSHILYLKECSEIEDFLILIGASKGSLSMIEVEIVKEVRNRANRVTNCETANIDKLVSASTAQITDIQLILDTKGIDWLPENLRQVALLRLENPDMSLRELVEASTVSISRSGMHHRLDKLSKLANSLRESQTGEADV